MAYSVRQSIMQKSNKKKDDDYSIKDNSYLLSTDREKEARKKAIELARNSASSNTEFNRISSDNSTSTTVNAGTDRTTAFKNTSKTYGWKDAANKSGTIYTS